MINPIISANLSQVAGLIYIEMMNPVIRAKIHFFLMIEKFKLIFKFEWKKSVKSRLQAFYIFII